MIAFFCGNLHFAGSASWEIQDKEMFSSECMTQINLYEGGSNICCVNIQFKIYKKLLTSYLRRIKLDIF